MITLINEAKQLGLEGDLYTPIGRCFVGLMAEWARRPELNSFLVDEVHLSPTDRGMFGEKVKGVPIKANPAMNAGRIRVMTVMPF